MKKYSKKIMLCVFGGILLAIIAISLIFALANRTEYYECTEYTLSVKTTGDPLETDHLKEYNYYRLYLSKGKQQFTLEYLIKGEKEPKKYTGYYTVFKDKNIICLDYKGKEEMSVYPQEPDGKVYYKLSGNTLTRIENETATEPGDFQSSPSRQTVYQTFKKKISW